MIQVNGVMVKIGQVWEDCDRRTRGKNPRLLTVVAIETDGQMVKVKSSRGPTTWIKASRLKPGSTGYKLVKDVEPVATGLSSGPAPTQ
jgi:hypothetical protein